MFVVRKPLILALLAVVAATVVVAWHAADLPPPKFLLRYGLSPGCEPTGETVTLEGVEFVEIGPGVFRMGSEYLATPGDLVGRLGRPLGLPQGERPEPTDEMPVHWVEFPRGFFLARTELTNAQYASFDPEHERSECSDGDEGPVVNVSWEDAKRYCAWLSEKSGREIRLPSESEWECACRSGSDSEYCFGEDGSALPNYGWVWENSDSQSSQVGTRCPNAWGIRDLHGNVSEWCLDTYQPDYADAPLDGSPRSPGRSIASEPVQARRVCRGGSWNLPAKFCRTAFRSSLFPHVRANNVGFRPAFTRPPEE